MNRGFSTLEMLIAMAIMSLALSAVVLVSFGNQGALIGGESNAEAVTKAQALLEQEQEYARKDFRMVNSFATTTDGIYQKWTSVEVWPDSPYWVKKVSVYVSWKDQRQISRSLNLNTLVSNFTNAVGGDTCSSAPSGDWSAPVSTDYSFDNTDLLSGSGLPAGETYTIGGVDAYQGKLYVGASKTSSVNDSSFFIFDISHPPQKPTFVSSLDNAAGATVGLAAVQAGNTVLVSGVPHTYAYAANAIQANFSGTCTASPTCSQLQVIDITDPASPSIVTNFKFATSSYSTPNTLPYVNGSAGQAAGNALFYKDGYVYLGLTKTSSGPEFNVIDVHNPLNPVPIGTGYTVGNTIESIYVRGTYAYLATDDNTHNLIVLDLTDPAHPVPVTGAVYNPGGLNGANRVYSVGDSLYLGKQYAGGPAELFKLNITNSGSGVPTPASTDKKVLGSSVMGLLVRDSLVYLITSTTKQLQILNMSASNISTAPVVTKTLPGTGAALECELNTIYAASNNGSNGFISVVKPAP